MRLHAEKMLIDGNLTPTNKEAVQVQLEELARLNKIIDELLFLSRADARAIKIDLKVQDPESFLRGFAQDATALTEFKGRQFTYVHQGHGCAPFNEKWMRQVLLNLVTNALNASPPDGRITLSSLMENDLWRVSVEDEGPGLTPDQRSRIFERFVRFGPPSVDDRGSGLGLAICRSIVALHSGRIFATDGQNSRGLQVVIEIPAERPQTADKEPATSYR